MAQVVVEPRVRVALGLLPLPVDECLQIVVFGGDGRRVERGGARGGGEVRP